jgi:hypothetical protein
MYDMKAISFIIGAGLVCIGILGGGLEIKELKVPSLKIPTRILSIITGVAFLGIAMYWQQPSDNLEKPGSNKSADQRSPSSGEQIPEGAGEQSETKQRPCELFYVYDIPKENGLRTVPIGSTCIVRFTRGGFWSLPERQKGLTETYFSAKIDGKDLEKYGPKNFEQGENGEWHIYQDYELPPLGYGEHTFTGVTYNTPNEFIDSISFKIQSK